MKDTLRADVLVLGFGKGGKTVAGAMIKRGKRVVLVEQSERMYGGTCPNGDRGRRAPAHEPPARLRARDVDGGPQFTYISLDDSRIVMA